MSHTSKKSGSRPVCRVLFVATALIFSAACHVDRDGLEQSRNHEDYSELIGLEYNNAKMLLSKKGFYPSKDAVCSEKMICSNNNEMATSIDSGMTCGFFFREPSDFLRVCLISQPDRWVVDKIERDVNENRDTHK